MSKDTEPEKAPHQPTELSLRIKVGNGWEYPVKGIHLTVEKTAGDSSGPFQLHHSAIAAKEVGASGEGTATKPLELASGAKFFLHIDAGPPICTTPPCPPDPNILVTLLGDLKITLQSEDPRS